MWPFNKSKFKKPRDQIPPKPKEHGKSIYRRKDFCDERHKAQDGRIECLEKKLDRLQAYIIGGFTFTIITLVGLIVTLIVTSF